jgi:hypothetical protein
MTNSAPSTVAFRPPPDANIIGETNDKQADADNIYLDLDTILDTRMGTLAGMSDDLAVQALQSGRYHKRMVDEFDGVNKDVFKAAYEQRNLDTLKRSVLTNMVFFMRRLIKDSLMEAVIQQKVEKMCFTINVWPYDFSDDGLVDMLIACIRFHTYSTSSVQIVSIPPEELTPEYCVKNYQIMIRYNWIEWVDAHKAFFEQRGIPTVAVVVPEIFVKVPTQDEIDQLGLLKQSPFKMTEQACASLFRLKHMPISLFSIHEAITQDSAAEMVRRVEVTETDIKEFLDKHHPKAELVRENPLPDVDLNEAYELL